MSGKIILVGQAPGSRGDPKQPLAGAAGRRLAALANIDLDQFLDRFERVNLLGPQLKAGKGDAFDVRAARDKADALRLKWRGRKAVLLGRGVAAAFRLVPDDYQWFKPLEVPPGVEVAVMPHPSGISHWWNDSANVEAAREFMLRLKVGWTSDARAALAAAKGDAATAAQILAEETGKMVEPADVLAALGRTTYIPDGDGRFIDVATGGTIAGRL